MRDVNLVNVSVTANPGVASQTVGTLAGINLGTVSGVIATGTVNGGTVTDAALGGLVGANGNSASGAARFDHGSHANVDCEQRQHQRLVGRSRRIQRAGFDHLRLIRQRRRDRHRRRQKGRRGLLAFSNSCQHVSAGGLVGDNLGTIASLSPLYAGMSPSAATAPPAGSSVSTAAIIANAVAIGSVTGAAGTGGINGEGGSTTLGGLVGVNQGLISGSSASGNVGSLNVGSLQAGGLVGDNSGTIQSSVASGNVQAGRRQQCRRPGRVQFGLCLQRLHERRWLAVLQHRRHLRLARVRRRHRRCDERRRRICRVPATA